MSEDTWPWRLRRNWSNGCEVCPDIYLGDQWIATVVGAPHLGSDSLRTGRRIVAALNATKDLTTQELEGGPVGRWPAREDATR